MAITNRPIKSQLTFHSDRGVQYACCEFREVLNNQLLVIQSMSRKSNCWDNAVSESLFRTLKTKLIHHMEVKPREMAKIEIFEFIEIWYSRNRIHASLGYLTPNEYEAKLNYHQKAA